MIFNKDSSLSIGFLLKTRTDAPLSGKEPFFFYLTTGSCAVSTFFGPEELKELKGMISLLEVSLLEEPKDF